MSRVSLLVDRLLNADWNPAGFDRECSRAILMREYLRRSALWASALDAETISPFFDAARLLYGVDVAGEGILSLLRTALAEREAGTYGTRMSIAAVNLAAARDEGRELPLVSVDLYEPLVIMFERGGEFILEGSPMVDVDTIGVLIGDHSYRMSIPAIASLDSSYLDGLDS